MKNTGLEYEVLVQSIFQEIHNQDSARNIIVERDVKFKGKSGTSHQVDVFWEFEIAGVRYLTIVQCKDWNSTVKQEQIFSLKTVLEDLPKQPRGIIVTKKGFQKGAKEFAKHHGIELFELKEEGEQISLTFDSIMQLTFGSFANLKVNREEQCLDSTIYPVKFRNIKIHLNDAWKKRKIKTLGNEIVNEALKYFPSLNQSLLNAKYQPIETIKQVLLKATQPLQEEAKSKLKSIEVYQKELIYKFTSPTYYSTESRFLPYIRIEKVSLSVEITQNEPYRIPFVKTGLTTFILKNIIDGRERKVDISSAKTK